MFVYSFLEKIWPAVLFSLIFLEKKNQNCHPIMFSKQFQNRPCAIISSCAFIIFWRISCPVLSFHTVRLLGSQEQHKLLCTYHSALMSVELIAFGHVQWNLSKFLYAKNHFLASKGKETPSIKHRWHWTVYPCGYRQYVYTSVQGTYFHQVIFGTKFEIF